MKYLVVAIFTVIKMVSGQAQSESHDFVTYDSSVFYKINQWDSAKFTFRISRPKIIDGRPAFISVPGKGEQGVDPAKLQVFGPHYWLNHGWDGAVPISNGTHYPILITMIFREGNSYPNMYMWATVIDRLAGIYGFKSATIAGLSYGSWVASGVAPISKIVKSFIALSGAGTASSDYKMLGSWARHGGKGFLTVGYNDHGNDIQPPLAAKAMQDSAAGSVYYTYNNVYNGYHGDWNTEYDPKRASWWTGSLIYTRVYPGTYRDGMNIYQWGLMQGDTALVGQPLSPPIIVPPPVVVPAPYPVRVTLRMSDSTDKIIYQK